MWVVSLSHNTKLYLNWTLLWASMVSYYKQCRECVLTIPPHNNSIMSSTETSTPSGKCTPTCINVHLGSSIEWMPAKVQRTTVHRWHVFVHNVCHFQELIRYNYERLFTRNCTLIYSWKTRKIWLFRGLFEIKNGRYTHILLEICHFHISTDASPNPMVISTISSIQYYKLKPLWVEICYRIYM